MRYVDKNSIGGKKIYWLIILKKEITQLSIQIAYLYEVLWLSICINWLSLVKFKIILISLYNLNFYFYINL